MSSLAIKLEGSPKTLAQDIPEGAERGALHDLVGGDWVLYRQLVEIFLAECPRLMVTIRSAITRGNARGVQLAAHSLRGTAGHFQALAACELSARLESMGRSGTLTGAEEAYLSLTEAVARLERALEGP